MLWSLIKLLVFVVIVGALAMGASWLLEAEGGVQVTFAGTEYTLGPLESVIALLVLTVALWVVLKLASFTVATLKFLNGDETAISRYFDRNRERKGYQALSESLMALASGEGKLAMSKASRAQRFLGKPELTDLVTAQAAEMSGDTKKASEAYKKLIGNEATRFVGVRGIMKQKLVEGDKGTALKLAEKAFQMRPRHEEVQDTLLTLQADARDWTGARKTLSAKLKNGNLPRDVYTRREAVLALSEAKDIVEEDATIEAREAAIEANRLSPDLIPAAAMAARSYIEQNKPRLATRVLRKAWDAQPHPDLAAAFAAIVPDETPRARIERFAALTKSNTSHPETRLLLAELNVAAEDFPEARRAMGDLIESHPDARAFTLMAAIERGEGSPDAVVRGWLARALDAPRGPQWVCDNCQHIHGEWSPTCENCGAFDTLSWREPPVSHVSSATGMQMLPLIIGQIEDKRREHAADADVTEGEVLDAEASEPAEGAETVPVEEPTK